MNSKKEITRRRQINLCEVFGEEAVTTRTTSSLGRCTAPALEEGGKVPHKIYRDLWVLCSEQQYVT